MRDPDRVWAFSNKFAAFWYTYCSDLRFWKVINVIAPYFENKMFQHDPFYAEEDWEKAIDLAAKNYEKVSETP
jgi:hypothetical protein